MGVEVAWGNFLLESMGCSAFKAREIHNGTVRAFVKVSNKMLDTLELWCRWVISISREMVDCIHDISVGKLHNM